MRSIIIAIIFLSLCLIACSTQSESKYCSYVFKSTYDFAKYANVLLNEEGDVIQSGTGDGITQAPRLEDDYFLWSSFPPYDCDLDFHETYLLVDWPPEDYESFDWSNKDLIFYDTYSEFYYCYKENFDGEEGFLDFDILNELIINKQLQVKCEKVNK